MATTGGHTAERRQTLFVVLACIFLGNALLAELIGGKLFTIPTPWGRLAMSCGIVLWPVVFIMTDIINEYFGRSGVRQLSFIAAVIIAYAYLALWITQLVPAADFSPVDDASFARVFLQSRWIIVGSIAAFLIAQVLDVTVFWVIRRRTGHRLLWLRSTGSTIISQLVDTFVVQFVGLYLPFTLGGRGVSFENFVNSASTGYVFKLIVAVAVTPVLYLVHGLVDEALGHGPAEELVEAVARTEHADDATISREHAAPGRTGESRGT
jgi:queuosine precursor transporter